MDGNTVDMEAHFFRVRRPFFLTYFFTVLAFVGDGNLLLGEPIWHSGRPLHILLLAAATWGSLTRNRKAHYAIVRMAMIALVSSVVTRFWIPS